MDLLKELPVELYTIILSYLDYVGILELKSANVSWKELALSKFGTDIDYVYELGSDDAYKDIFVLEDLIARYLIDNKYTSSSVSNIFNYIVRIVIPYDINLYTQFLILKNLNEMCRYNLYRDPKAMYISIYTIRGTSINNMIRLHLNGRITIR
jgi:hypothetical protein